MTGSLLNDSRQLARVFPSSPVFLFLVTSILTCLVGAVLFNLFICVLVYHYCITLPSVRGAAPPPRPTDILLQPLLLATSSPSSFSSCYPPLRATMWLEMLTAVVAVVVATLVCLRVWIRLTSGRCTSGKSMKGKTVVITGATSGIGKETARDLLRRGARVILACRNLEKGCRVAGELRPGKAAPGEVAVRHLDTSDLSSVRTFAKEVLGTEKAIHVLINNAGVLIPDKRQVTRDGFELTMATNYFGHFLLTNLLLARLKESAPSRVVTVSSLCHEYAKNLDLKDLNFDKESYTMMKSYNMSKLCNVLFARELADKTAGTGVTSNSLHPGIVATNILDNVPYTFSDFLLRILSFFVIKDSVSGAQTTIHLAVSEEVEGVTGRYFADCKETATSKLASRKDLATGLWNASVKAVGLKQDEAHY